MQSLEFVSTQAGWGGSGGEYGYGFGPWGKIVGVKQWVKVE